MCATRFFLAVIHLRACVYINSFFSNFGEKMQKELTSIQKKRLRYRKNRKARASEVRDKNTPSWMSCERCLYEQSKAGFVFTYLKSEIRYVFGMFTMFLLKHALSRDGYVVLQGFKFDSNLRCENEREAFYVLRFDDDFRTPECRKTIVRELFSDQITDLKEIELKLHRGCCGFSCETLVTPFLLNLIHFKILKRKLPLHGQLITKEEGERYENLITPLESDILTRGSISDTDSEEEDDTVLYILKKEARRRCLAKALENPPNLDVMRLRDVTLGRKERLHELFDR